MRAFEDMFAHETPTGLRHFFPSPEVVRMNGGAFSVVSVRLTPDETGSYWCWWDARKDAFRYVYDAEMLVAMCFPNVVFNVARGDGKVIRVSADVLGPVES